MTFIETNRLLLRNVAVKDTDEMVGEIVVMPEDGTIKVVPC